MRHDGGPDFIEHLLRRFPQIRMTPLAVEKSPFAPLLTSPARIPRQLPPEFVPRADNNSIPNSHLRVKVVVRCNKKMRLGEGHAALCKPQALSYGRLRTTIRQV